jgi:predicted MFS family arabinose efflux permease
MAYGRVLVAALLCYAALGAVLRALPGHLTDLGAGPLAIGIAVGAPAITGLVARPGGGRLADRLSPRAVLPAGAVIMAAGVVPALHDSISTQLGSRLLVGAGEGLMMSAAVLWLLRLSGPDRRGRALGHIGLANYGGLAIGPLLADVANGFDSVLIMAAVGLVLTALGPAVVGVVLLGAGQALAVPALGLLALASVDPARHGVAAGLFFSWFDAGVGLGGPAAGVLAQLGGPTGALAGAAIAVACTAPIALLATGRSRGGVVVN